MRWSDSSDHLMPCPRQLARKILLQKRAGVIMLCTRPQFPLGSLSEVGEALILWPEGKAQGPRWKAPLAFLDMIWVHAIHALGMLGVLGLCSMLQDPCHMLPPWHVMWPLILITREVMGPKHDKVTKLKGQMWSKKIVA